MQFPFPTLHASNELVWPRLNLKSNVVYGFAAEVKVPGYNPVLSSKAFIFELGYQSATLAGRYKAVAIEYQTTTTTTVPVKKSLCRARSACGKSNRPHSVLHTCQV